ncbi:hypothetical protein M9H77_21686 [Catharanthus roseus]|uniref:Uncharacterized protein n=1 Tax=Catharanthus roseus TaxID=4058 RepID=A0ACC0ASF0_CATRO|nr:hypothetical protein M9H77_21686 [Catharanthus roseus]
MGNKQLIAENLTNKEDDAVLYEEFKQYLANKKKQTSKTSSTGSYSQVISEEDNITSYHNNTHKEIIFLLENKDLQWKNDPWLLMNRYLDTASYAATSYKQRQYYEQILKDDLICSYMEELKKELVKNLLPDDKTDISMAGSSNEDCLAGESQDPDLDEFSATDIDQIVQDIEDAARKELKD